MRKTGLLITAMAALATPATAQDFTYPYVRDMALDWCLYPMKECGRPAADRFCAMQGYSRALKFEGARSTERTLILGANQVCDRTKYDHCDRFSLIKCQPKGQKIDPG